MLSSLILAATMLFSVPGEADLSGMLTPADTGGVSYYQTGNGVTITLGEVPPLTETDSPRKISCTLKNANASPVSVRLRFYSTDTISVVAEEAGSAVRQETVKTVEILAKSEQAVEFLYVANAGTFSAIYPLSMDAAFQVAGHEPTKLRIVRLLKTDLPRGEAEVKDGEFIQVPEEGRIFLTDNRNYTAYRTLDGEIIPLPGRGWTGSDNESLLNINHGDPSPGGEPRRSLIAHPPYVPTGGSLFMEYPVELPKLWTRIRTDYWKDDNGESRHIHHREAGVMNFSYGVAIRETAPHEPISDGVTFRVWVRKADEPREKNVLLDEIHTTSKTWIDRTVDLADYADQKIILTLETNPGPENNTTCDSSYWSALALYSGHKPHPSLSNQWRINRHEEAIRLLQSEDFQKYVIVGKNTVSAWDINNHVIALEQKNGMRLVAFSGNQGMIDGVIAVGNADKCVIYDGIKVSIDGTSLGDAPHETFAFGNYMPDDARGIRSLVSLSGMTYHLETLFALRGDDAFTVNVAVKAESGDDPITSIEFGPASVKAEKIYYGHGYVVKNPMRRMQIESGGHTLATSHVGFDFENGLSLLMATKTPPDYLIVDPERQIYSLRVHPSTTFTLVPGTDGAMETAVRYRPLFENVFGNQPSSQVTRKAGRLVFDVWGRSFAQCQADMEMAIKYGVTDALFIKHGWQRWGYDVRLPDIWEPELGVGTLADLQNLEALCRKHGIPFALHDNYIDFYPDATGFSYRYVTRHADGTPVLAWNNWWAGTQSYQWRPDLFKPFLARNLELADKFLPTMDAYFVDVFTSMNAWDFYDDAGKKHSRVETLQCWANCFQAIGNDGSDKDPDAKQYKRPPTITISEAGDDFLIGALDGADVQWLELTPEQRDFTFVFPCEDWERVPWFAPVNRTRFSLHGVGYSDRYRGGRSWQLHHSGSDDYISMEMLSGHAPMVETWSIFPLSARKTWLAQHVMRRLADKEMKRVEFLDGNMHHQKVTWSDGTTVYVNRDTRAGLSGKTDPESVMHVETADGDVRLLTYHFVVLDEAGKVLSTICQVNETRGGVEFSRNVSADEETIYVDGRCYSRSGLVDITPRLAEAKMLGDRAFQLEIEWAAREATLGERDTFLHIFKLDPETKEPRQPGWVAGGERPGVPTTKWGTEEKLYRSGVGQTMHVPEDLPDGEYDILVGLFDARGGGGREHLMAEDTGNGRYSVGKLRVKRTPGGSMELSATPTENNLPAEFASLTANTTPLSAHGITTPGPVRVVKKTAAGKPVWTLTPLPVQNFLAFSVAVSEKDAGAKIAKILATPQEGGDPQEVTFTRENDAVTWRVDSEQFFDYTLEWE